MKNLNLKVQVARQENEFGLLIFAMTFVVFSIFSLSIYYSQNGVLETFTHSFRSLQAPLWSNAMNGAGFIKVDMALDMKPDQIFGGRHRSAKGASQK